MKKNKKDLKKHGIISTVQSPDEGEMKAENTDKMPVENASDAPKEHGIISVVQAPDEAKIDKDEH